MATTVRPRTTGAHDAPPLLPGFAVAAVAAVIAVAAAVVLPDITTAGRMTTTPTHYMGLLMANQPWNLLIFMAVPFVLIYGGLVPTELGLVPPSVGRLVTPVLAIYYSAAAVYLIRYAAWPLTIGGGWRGPADWIAVLGYIATAVPILGLTIATFTLSIRPGPQLVVLLSPRARPHRDDLRHARPVRAWLGRSWPSHALNLNENSGNERPARLRKGSPSPTGGRADKV